MSMRSRLTVGMAGLCIATVFAMAWMRLSHTTPAELQAERVAATDTAAYTLSGNALKQAQALGRSEEMLAIAGMVWMPLSLLLLLWTRAAARLGEAALCAHSIWAQGYLFAALALGAVRLLELPLALSGHRTARMYGLSVQGWTNWFAEWGKGLALEWAIGGLVAVALAWLLRFAKVRWWLWFWGIASCLVIAGVFVSPYVVDPLFNRFTPMQRANPALAAQLGHIAARAGEPIPSDRMFIMQASAKSTELNAYVTGFGASKRVVVWDTTIARSSPDDISFIFAHELGHYVLGHVALGAALTCLGLLPLFWAGDRAAHILVGRFGPAWRVNSLADWAGILVLAFVLSVLSALGQPIANAFSRAMEHDADVYGQEAVHGIVAAPQDIGRQSFDVLGRDSLDDPTQRPVFDWWFDTHPTLLFRAAFAKAYDPWAAGAQPKYFQP